MLLSLFTERCNLTLVNDEVTHLTVQKNNHKSLGCQIPNPLNVVPGTLIHFHADVLIGVARIKNWGWPKWTSEVNDQYNISGFIYMVLKSRDYTFKMFIFKKLSIVLYSVHWHMYMLNVHIKKLSLRVAVVANRSILHQCYGCQIDGFVAS